MRTFIKNMATLAAISGIVVATMVFMDRFQERYVEDHIMEGDAAHKTIGVPFVHTGDHKPVTQVHIGELFYVWNSYVKPQTCSIVSETMFIDRDNKIFFPYRMVSSWFQAGTYEFNEMMLVAPNTLPPGHYHLIKKTVNTCNGNPTYNINYDIEIDLLAEIPPKK